MLIYLDHAWRARSASGRPPGLRDLYDAVMEGAVERVRPKIMTVTATIAALLPIMWGGGAGISVTRRIAAPMIEGMISSTVLTLVVIPAVYPLWREWQIERRHALVPSPARPAPATLPAAFDTGLPQSR
jgi:Cu(I)/Ag(I) efflux system membrane protein CusA/SilA